MSEVRRDIVTDTWVIIDTENDSVPKPAKTNIAGPDTCPFCAGHEDQTPREIYAVRGAGQADWLVRVIANINPVLRVEGNLVKSGVGVYDMVSGIGANEVIVETPDHVEHFFELSDRQVGLVLETYRQRIDDLHKDNRLRYILIFKNHGPDAGAKTISHTHSELIALPATPIRVKQKLNGALEYYGYKERCLFCDILLQEIEMADRLVFQSDKFVVIAPYASRYPFQVVILPKRHQFSFTLIHADEIDDLSAVLKKIIGAIHRAIGGPSYNLILNDSPNLLPRANYWKSVALDYHWHFEITPRIYRRTGFELGTGFHINAMAPEKAAAILRSHL